MTSACCPAHSRTALAGAALLMAFMLAGPAQACYTVFNADGAVVLQTAEAPRYAGQAVTVPEGGRVAIQAGDCPAMGAPPMAPVAKSDDEPASAPPSRAAPLLTNVGTAAAARVPYARATPGIAVVPPAAAEQVWRQAPTAEITRQNAAPPVGNGTAETELVITEWADGRTEVERRPRR